MGKKPWLKFSFSNILCQNRTFTIFKKRNKSRVVYFAQLTVVKYKGHRYCYEHLRTQGILFSTFFPEESLDNYHDWRSLATY